MYMNMYEGLVVEIIYGSKTNKQKTCRQTEQRSVCVTSLVRENDKEYKTRHRLKEDMKRSASEGFSTK